MSFTILILKVFPRQKETAPALLQLYIIQDVPNSNINYRAKMSSSNIEMALAHAKKKMWFHLSNN